MNSMCNEISFIDMPVKPQTLSA